MSSPQHTPGNRPESTGGTTGQTAGGALGAAQEMASGAAQKAQDVASSAVQKAQDVASSVTERTDDAIAATGQKMVDVADTIRERAPEGGSLGTAASAVASQLEAGGRYLQEHGMGEMGEDLVALIRRYPVQAVFVGLGVGFLLGQASSRR